MGIERPGPGLGPGPVASRPILGDMGRPISPKDHGLIGPMGSMGQPKYFLLSWDMSTINTSREDKI